MIISEEQVQRALDYLHTGAVVEQTSDADHRSGVSADFMERVRMELASEPATRFDRVAEGREVVADASVSAELVAQKMIGRIISDSIR